jgi:hypothetical protein
LTPAEAEVWAGVRAGLQGFGRAETHGPGACGASGRRTGIERRGGDRLLAGGVDSGGGRVELAGGRRLGLPWSILFGDAWVGVDDEAKRFFDFAVAYLRNIPLLRIYQF